MKRFFADRTDEYLTNTNLGSQDYVTPVIKPFPIDIRCSNPKIPFILRATFKLRPPPDNKAALLLLAKFIYPNDKISNLSVACERLESIPVPVRIAARKHLLKTIMGEAYRIVVSMPDKEVYEENNLFNDKFINKVQLRLDRFGLVMYDFLFEKVYDVNKIDNQIEDPVRQFIHVKPR
ncbi:hypothetical protein TorRG33x02_327350 [Trema orientale]|uniref:Uncharacterized protein n=1 Tax=Trema orientale TaxID=63057 RepID=A0A2P5BAZ3_TREOI|nr:hypothetical protein TorRG33x02_327350 [Trema orientale]